MLRIYKMPNRTYIIGNLIPAMDASEILGVGNRVYHFAIKHMRQETDIQKTPNGRHKPKTCYPLDFVLYLASKMKTREAKDFIRWHDLLKNRHQALKNAEQTYNDTAKLVLENKDLKSIVEDLTDAVFLFTKKDLERFASVVKEVVLNGDRDLFKMLEFKKYQQKIHQGGLVK